MKKTKLAPSFKYIIIVCIVLLLANVGFGLIFVYRSRNVMKEIISERMIGISNTAASIIDGDMLKNITEEDVLEKTENYQEIYDLLRSFKLNNNFKYIYTVKDVGNKNFEFIIDEDPIDPADFGQEVVYTDALYVASLGTPAVDFTASKDEWGSYYSAFSPIKDTSGSIVGIVGVDFDSEWYETEISKNNVYFILISVTSLIIGGAIAILVTSESTKKFRSFNRELSNLSTDIDALTNELNKDDIDNKVNQEETETNDYDINSLSDKMHQMQDELKNYITRVRARAYMDTMTGVSNKTAYLDKVKEIDRDIIKRKASFTVIVFDINGLKLVNDDNGHECGDRFINNTAEVIKRLFGSENTYRIGGDEFIAVLQGESQKSIDKISKEILSAIDSFNETVEEGDFKVSCSFGVAKFEPDKDIEFRAVFKRADDEMYRYKALFYQDKKNDRRKN